MFFKKKSKAEMCEKLAHMLFARGYEHLEAREILLETIGLLDSASMGMRNNAEQSSTVRVMLALPTVFHVTMNKAKVDPDAMEAFIITLEDTLNTAKVVAKKFQK